MCKFMSCISNGEGKVLFLRPEDIVKIMCEGNKKSLEFNSHTSIALFFNIGNLESDKWNKWEYNPGKKELILDQLLNTDDSISVKKSMEYFFEGKDILFLENLYNRNSGDRNSGDGNSGNWNSGDRNSGNWNSGDRNSGNWNSGDGTWNYLCNKELHILFNKICTKKDVIKCHDILNPIWREFILSTWIYESEMTQEEKEKYPTHKTTGGYLKVFEYKEAFKVSYDKAKNQDKDIDVKIKSIKNFNKTIWLDITGIKI